MTIAACYVSNEGVVLGADSTSTFLFNDGFRHYNNEQKLFEIGEMGSTLGIVTWGLGGLPNASYRRLLAELSDSLIHSPPISVQDVADRWNTQFWSTYSTQLPGIPPQVRYAALRAMATRSPDEEEEMQRLRSDLSVGFILGGHVVANRHPVAFEVLFNPDQTAPGTPLMCPRGTAMFGGVPRLTNRIISAIDPEVYQGILNSPHWMGTQPDLDALIQPHVFHPQVMLPIREAVDWIYSMIFTTIKGIKFSHVPHVCGGPIEIALITADRRFRWVSHKGLDQALTDHSARGTY